MKTLAVALCLPLAIAAGAARAATVVDNLDQPIRNPAHVRNDFWSAQSFILPGDLSGTLQGITLRLGVLTDNPALSAELRADSPLGPGALLTPLGLPALQSGPTVDELLLPAANVNLAAGGTYWVVLAVNGGGSVDWSYAAGNANLGAGSFGNYAFSLTQGATWEGFGLEDPYLMRVETAPPVPEPAPALLLAAGLGLLGWLARRRAPQD